MLCRISYIEIGLVEGTFDSEQCCFQRTKYGVVTPFLDQVHLNDVYCYPLLSCKCSDQMLIWYSAMLLALEAGGVVNTRIAKMVLGDFSENQLMLTEKVGAAFDAYSIVAAGGDASKVIDCYRRHVASNALRLK